MILGRQENDEGFCDLMLWCQHLCSGGSGKDYSDIPRICYLRCKKTTGRLTSFVKEDAGLGHDYHQELLLVRNFVFKPSYVTFSRCVCKAHRRYLSGLECGFFFVHRNKEVSAEPRVGLAFGDCKWIYCISDQVEPLQGYKNYLSFGLLT